MGAETLITLKTPSQVESMRKAGAVVGKVLACIGEKIRAGVTTAELDRFAEGIIRGERAIPAFKGYHGFPATLCVSVNDEVVHGIPGARVLAEGDIVGIDVGAIVEGYYGDGARTFAVGSIAAEKQKLIEVTRQSLEIAIEKAKPGNRITDISHAVQTFVEGHRMGVVRQYVGHGIGTALHEEPQVPNYGKPGRGPEIRPGMAIAIEPMVTLGSHEVKVALDGWTVLTADGSWSAHFEDTVLITENGNEILTRV